MHLEKGQHMKAQIIGNYGRYFLSLLFLMSTLLSGKITLQVRDSEGDVTHDVAVGQPFNLQVQIDQVGGSIQYPHIDGLDDFAVHKSGFQLNTINGKSTAYYTYQVRIDKSGTYEIGPAHVQGHEASSTVKIVVSDALPEAKKNVGKPFLQLQVNKDTVFVGEKIACNLRLYYTDKKMTIQALGIPNQAQTRDVSLTEQKGPVQGTEEIDGIRYDYLEWQWNAYPRQAGKLLLPAYCVDYEQETKQQSRHLISVFGFLSKQVEQRRMYSNAVTITAMPLPEPVQTALVGTVSQFSAKLNPTIAQQGEGMVLKFAVTGDIDIQRVDIPELQNMPDSFKWYESKKYYEDNTKYIEFIVQGLKLGDWQLPPQQLTYFDIETKTYRTIETHPVAVTISPTKNSAPITSSQTTVDIEQEQEDQLPLDMGQWYAVPERSVPWKSFVIVIAGILVMWFFFLMRQYRSRGDTTMRKKKRAFVTARTQLKQAEKKSDTSILYQIFIHLFADRFDIPAAELTQDMIKKRMIDAGFSEKTCQDWDMFFVQVQEYSFFKTGVHDTVIFILAQKWLDELEKKI